MAPALPQAPPARREDVVGSGTKDTEDQDRYGKQEKAAYLASAFNLPASCC
jgi:hypothetical protein